jgi:hypothetical protein
MAKDDDDALAALVATGVLLLIGAGVYKVIKAIAGYEKSEIINKREATALATSYTSRYMSSVSADDDDDDDYYPDYEGEDLEDAEDDNDDD